MIKIKHVLLVLFSILLQDIKSQNYIFEGRIGSNRAILAFDLSENELNEAFYYLEKNKTIIPLISVVLDTNNFLFYTMDANMEDTFSKIFVTMKDFRLLIGTFESNDGLIISANFNFFDITKIKHKFGNIALIDELKKEVPFQYVYTADVDFTERIEQYGFLKGDSVIVSVEKNTRIPSLIFKNKTIPNQKISDFCDSLAIEHIVSFLSCEPEYKVSIKITRLDAKIISLLYFVKWNCGYSDKDFYYQGITFDRNTGELMRLNDILYFDKIVSDTAILNDSSNIIDYEKQIRKLLQNQFNDATVNNCYVLNKIIFDQQNYYLTNSELQFLPTFEKAESSCRNNINTSIMFSEIKNNITPKYKSILIP